MDKTISEWIDETQWDVVELNFGPERMPSITIGEKILLARRGYYEVIGFGVNFIRLKAIG